MKPKVLIFPVSGGMPGRTYVQVEQSVRRPPKKFSPMHLFGAYMAGFFSAIGVLIASLVG